MTYFKPASFDRVFNFKYPARTKDIIDTTSIETYSIIISIDEVIKNNPTTIIPMSVKYSPFLYLDNSSLDQLAAIINKVEIIIMIFIYELKGSITIISKNNVVGGTELKL